MDAKPLLLKIAKALHKYRLDAVMVGNAAAALQGAPVTTIDFDFMFRKTPFNLSKMKPVADELEAQILKSFYPISQLYRLSNEDIGLQIDFMSVLHGIRSFESIKADAVIVEFEGFPIHVASLAKIIKSKKALDRPRDRAVLEILEKTLHEKNQKQGQRTGGPEKRK